MNETKTTFIYTLSDPRTGLVRYIGMSKHPHKRLKGHIAQQRSNNMKKWLSELKQHHLVPWVHILEETPVENWQVCEKKWITYYRSKPEGLLNVCSGGNGVESHKAEVRACISLKVKAHLATPEGRAKLLARTSSPESKRKKSLAMKALYASPEARLRTSEAGKKRFRIPGELQRHADTCRVSNNRPEVKAKMAESMRRRYQDPEARRAASVASKKAKTPAYLAKQSASMLKRWSDPFKREQLSVKMKDICTAPEVRKRLLYASQKATSEESLQKRKKTMVKVHADPVVRKKRSDTLKKILATPEGKARMSKAATIRWQKYRLLNPIKSRRQIYREKKANGKTKYL